MREIGFVSTDMLRRMQRRGLAPDQAVEAILAEAKARYPEAGAVILQKRQDGFAVVEIPA